MRNTTLTLDADAAHSIRRPHVAGCKCRDIRHLHPAMERETGHDQALDIDPLWDHRLWHSHVLGKLQLALNGGPMAPFLCNTKAPYGGFVLNETEFISAQLSRRLPPISS